MARVMQKWMEESLNTLEEMELQLQEREAAVEQAMSTIRRYTDEIETLEKNIAIVKDALAKAEGQFDKLPEAEESQTTIRTPTAPPLRVAGAPPPPPTRKAK